MNTSRRIGRRMGRTHWLLNVLAWSVCLGLWCEVCRVGRAEVTLTEYQVKALFLLNFIKYVDWPPDAFAGSNAPITIGLCGESKLHEALNSALAVKPIGGRTIVIRQVEATNDLTPCQILFVSHSEAARIGGILDRARVLPILTVGEDELFARKGGIINFVLRNGHVRLEIDLIAAKKAGLTISSRLLEVADVVKGKAN